MADGTGTRLRRRGEVRPVVPREPTAGCVAERRIDGAVIGGCPRPMAVVTAQRPFAPCSHEQDQEKGIETDRYPSPDIPYGLLTLHCGSLSAASAKRPKARYITECKKLQNCHYISQL